jgi:excisionase family DNA binding protein
MTSPKPRAVPGADGVHVDVPPALVPRLHAVWARAVRDAQRSDARGPRDDELAFLYVLQVADGANAIGERRASPRGTTTGQIEPRSGWCSVVEAAKVLDTSPRWARRLAQRGDFQGAERRGRDWLIPRTAVDLYLARKGA